MNQTTTPAALDLDKQLTDTELADPEYMRAYVSEMQATIADLARRSSSAAGSEK
jgi:hypothetical protein